MEKKGNPQKDSSLRKKLERSHLFAGVLSVGLFSVILIVGYIIYTQTDYVARLAGEEAVFLADEFSEIMAGDPITPDLADDFILSSGIVPIIKADQEISSVSEYSDWLIILDNDWKIAGSNDHDLFPVGEQLSYMELPGFDQGHSIKARYASQAVPGLKLDYQFMTDGESDFGFAKMVDWEENDYGYIYYRAAGGFQIFTSSEAILIVVLFLAGSGLVSLLLSGLFGRQQAKIIGNRLEELAKISHALASGDFTKRAVEDMDDEIGQLAIKVNQMADQISDQMQELQAEISERQILQLELERLARTDGLTEINNRRHFLELAEKICLDLEADQTPFSVLMIDLDHFKSINDQFGHAVGDQVLRFFAAYLKENLRKDDVCGRYGGEEFICILPGMSAEQAKNIAERIRLNTNKISRKIAVGGILITISIGISTLDWGVPVSLYDLINQADLALYEAKQSGRNCFREYTEK